MPPGCRRARGSGALIFMVLLAIERVHRRMSFEVTPFALTTIRRGPFGSGRMVWPRASLLQVHLNRFNKKLVVRRARIPVGIAIGTRRKFWV
jgi:hypothetical protein